MFPSSVVVLTTVRLLVDGRFKAFWAVNFMSPMVKRVAVRDKHDQFYPFIGGWYRIDPYPGPLRDPVLGMGILSSATLAREAVQVGAIACGMTESHQPFRALVV